ncbi:hypothetical protein GYY_02525 [Methanococcus maripaludis X1]|uniref:Uncharacterized protein n=1 Tax=Methanococcus maripaludis X1 TaxID=1053692 RepID=G0H3J8_METMI|nr:hypothetical protein [Methanococcus maripaludis]AEK19388.1 hypothetical protein GYY_02525 [Methanococcus maripaludis X1]
MKLKMTKEEALQKIDEWGLPGFVKSHAVAFIISKKGAISIGELIAFVAVVIVLYIMTIILGNLEGPMTDAVANTSMAGIAASIQTTSASAMGLAGILPIIAVAVIMLGAVQMLRGGGGQ